MNVFNIQHFSTGDGPGIRTTVFLSGCNLRCPWCHNPEALYGNADSRDVSLSAVVEEVMSDSEFYEKSGGGVTISGGEPLCSLDDCLMLLKEFKKRGLNTIVDTALAVKTSRLDELSEYTDCYFVDVKTADSVRFKSVCGGDFEVYSENLKKLSEMGVDFVLRIPLIPGFNTDDKSICDIIEFIKPYQKPFTLLPFHRMASAKYRKLGLKYEYAEITPPTVAETEAIREKFISCGLSEADV